MLARGALANKKSRVFVRRKVFANKTIRVTESKVPGCEMLVNKTISKVAASKMAACRMLNKTTNRGQMKKVSILVITLLYVTDPIVDAPLGGWTTQARTTMRTTGDNTKWGWRGGRQ